MAELDRSMKGRHLNMIAIGGSIGAGFFVGSGSALTRGGPGSVLICFLITGVMIFNVVYALGELAVMYPVSGGFYTYSIRFIDPAWGFAMGWNYVSSPAFSPDARALCSHFSGLPMGHRFAARTHSLLFYRTILEQRCKRRSVDNNILGVHNIRQRFRHSRLC